MQRRDFFKGLAAFVTALVVSGRIPQAAKAADTKTTAKPLVVGEQLRRATQDFQDNIRTFTVDGKDFNAKMQDVFISGTVESKDILESSGYYADAITIMLTSDAIYTAEAEARFGKLYETHIQPDIGIYHAEELCQRLSCRGFYAEAEHEFEYEFVGDNKDIKLISPGRIVIRYRSLNPETARIIDERVRNYEAIPDTERGYITPFFGLHNDGSDPYGR